MTVTGGNTYNNENTYVVTLNNNATGGSFKIVNKSDASKIQTVTVQAPVATMTATNLTGLPVTLGTSQNSTVNSPEGFQASTTGEEATHGSTSQAAMPTSTSPRR